MRIAKYALIIVFDALLCTGSWAQSVENSRVTGLVTDPSGATVAGAQVQMTQTGTGLVRTVETNGDGTYTIPDLPSGAYQLQVRKEGFNTYVQSGIVLQVGSNPTLDVSLQVGSTAQAVTVTANAAIVETHSSSVGEVVNHQEILDIPLNARDPMQLLTLTPSAVVAGGYNTALDFPNPYTIAFAGTSPGVGTYILDGGNDNDAHTSDSYPLPFPDALQEFSAVLTAVPAQYGMHSSATVNAITKSGSNEFHGDAFEFVRNGDFNARSFYAPRRDPLKRNQFGGVLGGPIRKDKLFFFGAIQDTIVRDVLQWKRCLFAYGTRIGRRFHDRPLHAMSSQAGYLKGAIRQQHDIADGIQSACAEAGSRRASGANGSGLWEHYLPHQSCDDRQINRRQSGLPHQR